MISFISNMLTKLYWPTVLLYGLYLVIFSIMYFTEMHNWSNRTNYDWMNFKRIIIPGIFLCASLIAKYQSNEKMANVILYIPIGFALLILIGGLFILFLYSKANQ